MTVAVPQGSPHLANILPELSGSLTNQTVMLSEFPAPGLTTGLQAEKISCVGSDHPNRLTAR